MKVGRVVLRLLALVVVLLSCCVHVRASLRFARILERLVLRDPGLWLCLWGCDGGLTGVSMSFLFYVSGLDPSHESDSRPWSKTKV